MVDPPKTLDIVGVVEPDDGTLNVNDCDPSIGDVLVVVKPAALWVVPHVVGDEPEKTFARSKSSATIDCAKLFAALNNNPDRNIKPARRFSMRVFKINKGI